MGRVTTFYLKDLQVKPSSGNWNLGTKHESNKVLSQKTKWNKNKDILKNENIHHISQNSL